jgi:hypothetical protein
MMDEATFKKQKVEKWKTSGTFESVFCIETEETETGFPDVLAIDKVHVSQLYEFKVSDARGIIKFERGQPLFYKKYPHLNVEIVALDNRTGETVFIPSAALFDPNSQWPIKPNREVQL